MRLPAEEREALAEELYDSISGEPLDPAWEAAWSGEISRRAREVAEGAVALVDADEVHAEIRSELGRRAK